MTAEERKQIADTILEQLGGGRFILMTGAKDFSFGEAGELNFRLTLGKWRAVRPPLALSQRLRRALDTVETSGTLELK